MHVHGLRRRVQVVQGDLEDPLSLLRILSGAHAVYCHALGKDARTADPAELARARLLADAVRSSGVGLLMYNSSGGKGCGYGITQMEMKHQVNARDLRVWLITFYQDCNWCTCKEAAAAGMFPGRGSRMSTNTIANTAGAAMHAGRGHLQCYCAALHSTTGKQGHVYCTAPHRHTWP